MVNPCAKFGISMLNYLTSTLHKISSFVYNPVRYYQQQEMNETNFTRWKFGLVTPKNNAEGRTKRCHSGAGHLSRDTLSRLLIDVSDDAAQLQQLLIRTCCCYSVVGVAVRSSTQREVK